MNSKFLFTLGLFIILTSCDEKINELPNNNAIYTFGTENDSALFYFNKGWELILDYGQWTQSEKAFRKAVEFDSSFIIGKALIGKSTQNHEERLQLLKELEKERNKVSKDDQLILNVTLTTMELFHARDLKIKLDDNFISDFLALAEKNYKEFIHKHPHTSYIKAEYIEVLNAMYGPKTALDSLRILTTPLQKKIPFFISYAATLESDLGNFKKALFLANDFSAQINDSNIPQPYVLYGSIYLKMDSLSLAKSNIDKAFELDPNHIFAQRFKKQVYNNLNL